MTLAQTTLGGVKKSVNELFVVSPPSLYVFEFVLITIIRTWWKMLTKNRQDAFTMPSIHRPPHRQLESPPYLRVRNGSESEVAHSNVVVVSPA